MPKQRVGSMLDRVAADVIPADVDLWPTIELRLRPKGRSVRLTQGRLVVAVQTLAVVCLVLVVLLALSPEVRAQGGDAVHRIGQMLFRDQFPQPTAQANPKTIVQPLWPQGMSLDIAKAIAPFKLNLPSWAPEGYIFYNQVSILTLPQGCVLDCRFWQVNMHWQKPLPPGGLTTNTFGRNRIYLRVAHPAAIQSVTDLKSLEELDIKGRPTALMGVWGAVPADPRNVNLSKGLQWIEGDQSYMLIGWPGVPVEDLIHMAESIP